MSHHSPTRLAPSPLTPVLRASAQPAGGILPAPRTDIVGQGAPAFEPTAYLLDDPGNARRATAMLTEAHALQVLQARWDDEGAALVVRRYRVIPAPLPADPAPATALQRLAIGLACLAIVICGTLLVAAFSNGSAL